MGLVGRFTGLVKAFFSKMVGRVEDRNPELVFQELNELVEKTRREVRNSIIRLQTDAELIKIEAQEAKQRLESVQRQIEAAKSACDVELMTELLIKEEECESEYENCRVSYEKSLQEATKVREEYKIFEAEMNSRLSEIKSIRSRSRIASLRADIAAITNGELRGGGGSLNRLNETIARVKESVNLRTAQANAIDSLSEDDTRLKLRRLDMQERYKRAKEKAVSMLENASGE